jgi:NNP family nitrate/nitrite transporter-like MFS transporter
MESKIAELEKEIDSLHTQFEMMGKNSRGTTDIYGRKFAVPVDAEHKATKFVLATPGGVFGFTMATSNPHNRAFWTSAFGFFSSFFSMFAAAPLMPYMKASLDLTKKQIGSGNIAAVSTNIVMRVIVGFLSDMLGPRRSLAFLLLITTPAILGMMFVQTADAWIACRALIGIALATFVTCQVWCSQMYAKSVVGLANATAAGWGNLGGGVTNMTMGYIFLGMYAAVDADNADDRKDAAWRACYFVPLAMHVLGGLLVLSGRDLPDGSIKELETSGAKQKSKGFIVVKTGVTNVNAWILTLTYGMCFGIELTMNSVVAPYFHAYHGLTPQAAGLIGGLYGLMNLFARSWGGLLSDAANKKFGMRGRLWAMWIVQTLEGVMCMIMAAITLSYESPFGQEKTPAYIQLTKYNDYGLGTSTWVNVADYADAEACAADAKKCFKVNACGCRYAQSSLHTSCARSCTHPPLLSSGLTSRRRRCRRRLASRRRRWYASREARTSGLSRGQQSARTKGP